jgi:lipid-A-disaccharide synthase
MRYYLIAGERSGDLHGGNLLRSLAKHDAGMVARGFGGDEMKSAGMELTVHFEKLAFMGLKAVLGNLGTISLMLKLCKADILAFRPDVIILIDYGGFNMRIARFAKPEGLKVFYYISPKVWAWNTGRARTLKSLVERMFCILPFEKEFYKQFDWDVDYVGNPVLDAVKAFQPDSTFMQRKKLSSSKKVIALLPGSRRMELKRMIPVMAGVARKHPDYQFVVAAVRTLPKELYQPLENIGNVTFVFESTYDLLFVASAAIVTSGTATLETALFKVPQALIYRAGPIEISLFRLFAKVRFIGLPNLIAGRQVVRELFQADMTEKRIGAELDALINDQAYRARILKDYDEIYQKLDTGSASANAARLMVQYLNGTA